MAQNIEQCVFLPIPSLKNQPKYANLSREERLNTIIPNVEKNHKQVKTNIINAAREQLEQHQASTQTDQDSDAMEITPTSPIARPPQPEAMSHLLNSINTPAPPPGHDPRHRPGEQLPQPPSHIRQVTPPPPIQIAKQTLEAVEQYNDHAKGLTEFYAGALQRTTGAPAPRPPARRPEENVGSWGQPPVYSPRDGAPRPPPQGGRGPINASPREMHPLDPRRAARR